MQFLVAQNFSGDLEYVARIPADIERGLALTGAQVIAGDRIRHLLESGHHIAPAMGENGVQMHRRARTGHLAGDHPRHVATLEQRLGQLAHRLRGRSFAHADHDDTVPDGHDVAAFQRGRPEFPRRIAEPDPHSIREYRMEPVDCCHQQRFGPPCREMHRVQAHAAIDPG